MANRGNSMQGFGCLTRSVRRAKGGGKEENRVTEALGIIGSHSAPRL